MHTHKRAWMIAAAVLLVLGTALCAVSLASLGFDFSRLDAQSYETNTYEVQEAFETIEIHGNTDRIVLLPSEEETCSVTCQESETIRHEIAAEDGTLTIRTVESRKWYEYIGICTGGPSISVALPEDTYTALVIDGNTGDVEIPGDFTFGDIQIRVNTGDVVCSASAGGTLEIETRTGGIRATGLTAGEMRFSATTGYISLASAACEGDLTLRSTTGEVDLNDVTCQNVSSRGSTGSITLTDVVASGAFHIERGTGDVRFNGSDAASILVKTGTGDVTGTLRSEKVFLTETGTGDVHVPKTVAGGKCEITTGTGDVAIEIP